MQTNPAVEQNCNVNWSGQVHLSSPWSWSYDFGRLRPAVWRLL